MKTEIVIKLPLFKRWILKALIGGLLKNLEKSREFYKGREEFKGKESASSNHYHQQRRGIQQSINAVRLYCGMDKRDFETEDWLLEEDRKDIEKAKK